MAEVLKELKYTKDHEWIRVEGDVATIGVTDFASGELGDIVFVEVEEVGDSFEKEEVVGTIEAVKTVSDLFSPITGEIVEVNEELEDNPELINESPYEEGWILKMKISNVEDLNDLISADEYAELTGGEVK